jgi:hypothetical protein
MANIDVQTENPLPRRTTWHGARRWLAVLGLTAAVTMGWPVVACGSHNETGPTTTTTTTTTTSTPTTLPWGRHHDSGPPVAPAPRSTPHSGPPVAPAPRSTPHSGPPVAPAPRSTPPRAPVTPTTTPSQPAIPQPITPGPGDLVPFGKHWLRQPADGATTAQ